MNKYAETQQILNDMASVKMAMNSHKGEIENCDTLAILEMLRGEVEELEEALDGENLMHVIEEAADIQNFLVAIVHQKIAKYRSRK